MMIRVFILLVLLLLAGCGGSEDTTPQVLPTPTPQATLTIEERAQFAAGLAENPLRMAIRPVDTVEQRVAFVLINELGMRASRVNPDAPLTDLVGDDANLAALNAVLQRDFDVEIAPEDAAGIQIVRDLTAFVQAALGRQVSDAIFERTGLYVNMLLVEDYGDALENLCRSGSGIVSIAWLDGITYKAATAQGCGQPALQIAVEEGFAEVFPSEAEIEITPEAEITPESTSESAGSDESRESQNEETPDSVLLRTGMSGVIFTNGSLGSNSISLIEDRVFCRLGVDDFYSWFLPALVMEQNNLDPLRAPSQIVDYGSPAELVDAVVSGTCAMSGLSQRDYAALETDDLRLVTETIPFPYGVLMYPLEVGLGVRLSLNEHLVEIANDPEDGRKLRLLLGQNAILPAVVNDFAALDAFLDATGYDFAQMGN